MLSLDVLHTLLCLQDSRFGSCQVMLYHLLSLLNLFLVLGKLRLHLDRPSLLLFRLVLIRNHALQLLICFSILLSKLCLFLGKACSQLLDLVECLTKLLETNVEMALLLLQVLALLVVELDILCNKVQEVTRREVHLPVLCLLQLRVLAA